MVTVTLCSILSMVLYLFCEMVYLIAQYYELAIGEVLKQWPAVIQIAFSPDNLAESWFQLIFFLGGLAWFLITRPLISTGLYRSAEIRIRNRSAQQTRISLRTHQRVLKITKDKHHDDWKRHGVCLLCM